MPTGNWRRDKSLTPPLTKAELARLYYVITGHFPHDDRTKEDITLMLRMLVR